MPYGSALMGLYGSGPLFNSLLFNGSSQYLSMAEADFGGYDNAQFAFIASVNADSLSTSESVIFGKGDGGTNIEYQLSVTNNGAVRFYGSGFNLTTNNSIVAAGSWYAIMVHYDSANGTPNDRLRMWVNNSEITTFASRTNPSSGVSVQGGDARIGLSQNGSSGFYFDGKIYAPALTSGALPSAAAVFDGTSGKLKNLSGLTGLYSFIPATTNVVSDDVLATDWTNNGGVTLSTDKP